MTTLYLTHDTLLSLFSINFVLTSEYLLLGSDPVDPKALEGVWSSWAGPIASNLDVEGTFRELRFDT